MGNREKLLEAARKCLFEKGYERTTVRELASAAGVSMAAIGYHFGSKEALLNQALFEALDSGGQALGPSAGDGDLGALWQRLIEAFSANRTFWLANLETILRAQRDPELRGQVASGLRQGRSGMAYEVTGTPEGELSEETVRTLGSVQLALLGGLMMQHITDPESAPTADEVLAGIRALAARLPDEE
ncbi:TetR/AcrR family transcriptional regulator [Streptomyces drozdowiczii]|uniref:TetR/AcrR family transcriptional regulator n=2 Tax=Streptomyces drozdowiczii TaxID=202862 RepID=A0ABY6Q2B8_9ACTN|nr:TetR/AcrR family transcriptional regulator [Streptomyces drozdowiczii]MCX0244077.1 TetR/AcrR family transcriptional regulator [Streptomyces drozdowiczii]UZK58572.1 TetR/AcrR family transcriptional regulator [Streptomyces drozdowiczii]